MVGMRAWPFLPSAGFPEQATFSSKLLTESAKPWSGLPCSSFPGSGMGLQPTGFPTQATSSHGHNPFHQASCPPFSVSASVSWRTWANLGRSPAQILGRASSDLCFSLEGRLRDPALPCVCGGAYKHRELSWLQKAYLQSFTHARFPRIFLTTQRWCH